MTNQEERTVRTMRMGDSNSETADSQQTPPANGRHRWEPSVAFGGTLILTAVVLFFSVTNPRELDPVRELDERWSLRALAAPSLLPGVKNWLDLDMFAAEAKWACVGVEDCPDLTEDEKSGQRLASSQAAGGKRNEGGGSGGVGGVKSGIGQETQKADNEPKGLASRDQQKTEQHDRDSGSARHAQPERRSQDDTLKRQQDPGEGTALKKTRKGEQLELGVNLSLIPGTGWGNLAYEIFFGFLLEENASFLPVSLPLLPCTRWGHQSNTDLRCCASRSSSAKSTPTLSNRMLRTLRS